MFGSLLRNEAKKLASFHKVKTGQCLMSMLLIVVTRTDLLLKQVSISS